MNPLAIGLALAIINPQAFALGAEDTGATESVGTKDDVTGRLTVPVRLGDQGPFRFLIDTGAQNTVVSSSLSDRLALPAGSPSTVIGVAGSLPVRTVEIDEISLGKRSYYGLLAPVLERSDIGAEGILGLDSLQDQRVMIDFQKNLMAVDDARALGGDSGFEIVVTARRRSGQLIMANASIDGVRCDVVIDTGSDMSIGNRQLQNALGKRGTLSTKVTLHSVTGQDMTADIGMARHLELQDAIISNVAVAFSDSPTFAFLGLARRPALFLGIRELRAFPRVAIDFKTRRVLLALPKSGDPVSVAPLEPAAHPSSPPSQPRS